MSDDKPRPPRRPGEPPSGSRRPNNREEAPQREIDPYDYESIFTEPDVKVSMASRVPRKLAVRTTVAVVVVLALIFGVIYAKHQTTPSGGQGLDTNVDVPAGTSFSGVAKILETKKVIPNALFMRIWAKLNGGAPTVKAGEYAFQANSSDAQALKVLKGGPKPLTDRLLIPEGYQVYQVANAVGNLPGMSSQKFYALATNGSVRSKYEPAGSNNLEGLLYPDTYLLSASDTEATLLKRMISEFENEAAVVGLDSANSAVGHTPYETIVIASMIEAEAKLPDDRGKISQVIENRLFDAMPLQIDATVIYALNNTTRNLSNADLKYKSPYNTYVVKGLPPGPINSPGAASLKAALAPTPGPWLYYVVTSKDGGHSFATTLAEQNANIALAKSRGLR